MSWIEDTLADFGKTMGISPLAFSGQGVVRLCFVKMGTLFIERGAGEVLVYLVREPAAVDGTALRRALELCHYRHQHPVTVQAGLHGDSQLIFLARIPETDFQLPVLERVVGLLKRLQDDVS